MLRIVAGAALLGLAHGAGKCVNRDGATWEVTDAAAVADCANAGDQWIGEHAQELFEGTAPKPKTWWTKRMTKGTGRTSGGDAAPAAYDRLFFGGQPSERDLKMMYEQGFDAVYSLWPFPETGAEIDSETPMPTGTAAATTAAEAGLLYGMIDTLPPQAEAAESCADDPDVDGTADCNAFEAGCEASCPTGCVYAAAQDEVAANAVPAYNWLSEESIDQLEAFLDFALTETDGAIYVHCYIGRTASAALQAYRARKAAKLAASEACGVDPCPALVAQAGKSLTQTAVIEAGYHGFDISRPAWYARLAEEAGETYTAAADLVPAVELRAESCADDPDVEGTADCTYTATCGDTCPDIGCIFTAALEAAGEVPAVEEVEGTAGARPDVAFPEGATTSNSGTAFGLSKYHWMKVLGRLGNTILYDAGQIHAEHMDAIARAGVKVVVNMRKAAQEETNLLNVKSSAKVSNEVVAAAPEKCASAADSEADCATAIDLTSDTAAEACATAGCTYSAEVVGVVKARQDATWLADDTALTGGAQHVVDSDRPNGWAGEANVNFEVLNEHEFGDSIGYNQAIEAAAWGAAGVEYHHLPVGGSEGKYDAETLVEYADDMIEAINSATEQGGHVLFHCRTGYRTGAFPAALLAAVGADTPDAISARMASLGYDDAGNIATLLDIVADDAVGFDGTVGEGTITGRVCLGECPEEDTSGAAPVSEKTSGAAAVSAAASLVSLLVALFA